MSAPDDPLLPAPRAPRRVIRAALLRSALDVVALVALYYLLPFDRSGPLTVLLLLGGFVLFTGIAVWQVRAILGSDYPVWRAIEALAIAVPLFLVLFAAVYFLMAQAQPTTFTEPMTRTDSLYFAVTVFATVGFGDISAVSQAGRSVVTGQMIANLLVFGLLLRTVLGAVRVGQERRTVKRR